MTVLPEMVRTENLHFAVNGSFMHRRSQLTNQLVVAQSHAWINFFQVLVGLISPRSVIDHSSIF